MLTYINAYDEGVRAFHDGLSLNENPYRNNTSYFFEWEDGWRYANEYDPFYDDERNS